MQRSRIVQSILIAALTVATVTAPATAADPPTLVGWGDNTYGQSEAPSPYAAPATAIEAESGVGAVAVRDGRIVPLGYSGQPSILEGVEVVDGSIAIKSDGTAVTFGYPGANFPPPNNLGAVVDVAGGVTGEWFLAVTTASTNNLRAWGNEEQRNCDYECRDVVPEELRTVPSQLQGTRVTDVATGSQVNFAVTGSGGLFAWGPYSGNYATGGLTGVVAVAAFVNRAIALKDDGTVVVLGSGLSSADQPPTDLDHVVAVDAGSDRFIALKADGTVVEWGNSPYPIMPPSGLTGVTAVSAGSGISLALLADGSVRAWGYPWQAPMDRYDLGDAVAVETGDDFSMALRADGTVVAWGQGGRQAAPPDGLANVKAISSGIYPKLALHEDGTVVDWGWQGCTCFVQQPTGLKATALAAGGRHALALRDDKTVVGWGDDLGNGVFAPPDAQNHDFTAIAAGDRHSLGLRSGGTVVGWGAGPGATVPDGVTDVKAISAGNDYSLALKQDGTVVGWGDGSVVTGLAAMADSLTGIVAIDAGYYHALALKGDGTVVAWGNNSWGQATTPDGLSGVTAISAGVRHSLALMGAVDDGIDDSLQPQGTPAGSFVDNTTAPHTVGSIVDANGLDVTVSDAQDPDGVRVVVGAGTGQATLSVCGLTVEIDANSTVILTCGSVIVKTEEGKARVVLDDGLIVVTVPKGGKAEVQDTDAGAEISNVESTDEAAPTVTVNGTTSDLDAEKDVAINSWILTGFRQPVDNDGVVNIVKAGSAVPLKWHLESADGPVTDLASATADAEPRECEIVAADQIELLAPSGSGLINLGGGDYQLDWKTPKSWTRTCKTLVLDVGGGITKEALFQFK